MIKPWTPDFELKYWNAEEDQYYIDNLKQKYSFFKVDKLIREKINLAIDIGGGKFGGALYLFENARRSILIDILADKFRKMKKLPPYVETITSDFADIPLESFCADIIFAWNTFDHASNTNHFISGLQEIKRLLKPEGLFFGSFPMRKQPKEGHPICITKEMVFQQLDGFYLLKDFVISEPYYRDNVLFVIAKR